MTKYRTANRLKNLKRKPSRKTTKYIRT